MQPGIRAARRNWAPFLLIQTIAAALVVCYYRFAGVRLAARSISEAKHAGGELFVIVAGAVAGGLLPQVAKALTGRVGRIDRSFWIETAYVGFVFAAIAVQVNTFYQLQVLMFGSGIDAGTLVRKTFVDMFVVSPTLFVPTGMFLLFARQVDFQPIRMRQAFSRAFYRTYVVPALPASWAFWIPMVLCIYSLPTDLQFPFAQLAEAAWSLLFVFMANDVAQR